MLKNYTLRLAQESDAAALLKIYAPFVESGRIRDISAKYPYIVCEQEGELIGYVYAHPHIPRAAYQWGAEVTIYLAPAGQGVGLGRVMYTALERLLRLQGVVVTYACVTASNEHSVRMHEALGYKIVGTFNNTGFKHGHWLDMVWLEKRLADLPAQPAPLRGVQELAAAEVAEILQQR